MESDNRHAHSKKEPRRFSRTRRALAIPLLAATLFGGLAVTTPAEAEARTTLNDLRNCIKTRNSMSWTGKITTRVTNDCTSAKYIYIDRVWPYSDGTCSRVEAGGTKTWNQGRWGTWKATGKEC